ncbi:unnamed protein product [Adineta steineri]|uniref:Pyrrolo-quinoline quinone repeat domain-containing protein n=1 Tax=Adineta steineri TaxID=433720 RepID=A0A815IFS0_9BILA|nr:unnamed protein product [Adineta steineri]CAF1365450.1 unnamed protein product [Adineta steineri]
MLSIITTLLIWNNISALEWWNGWSVHDNNDRFQRDPLPITPTTTKTEFKQLWYTVLDGPIEMSPTIYQQYIYIASWNGTFYCLQADTGKILWQKNLSTFINNGRGYISRTSPIVYNDMIIMALSDAMAQIHKPGNGSYAIAFDRFTGELRWKNRVSSHSLSKLTSSPQLANNTLFVGISSVEENMADDPTYPCCVFQGSVVAVNATTGMFLWETKMMPDNNGTRNGYAGGTVWGSQFPVDYKRNQIYVATANYYKLPPLIQQCVNDTANLTLYSDPCDEPGAYGQSIVALDMTTGLVRWSRNFGPINAYVDGCTQPHPNCPPYPGPDSDFAQAPIFKLNLKYKFGGENRDQVFAAQKSGIAFGLDAETGKTIWVNQVAPGSNGGGMKFGSAADDQYLYVGNMNAGSLNYTLPNGTITTKASWSAVDLVTGDIKWTAVDPTTGINKTSANLALTVWDQLVLVQGGSYSGETRSPIKGCLYGLNKTNGEVLYEWCIENTPLGSGASVANNTIYVGIGYARLRPGIDGIVALQLPSTP